jgi:hypothetical protein
VASLTDTANNAATRPTASAFRSTIAEKTKAPAAVRCAKRFNVFGNVEAVAVTLLIGWM